MSFVDLGKPPPLDVYPAWSQQLVEKVDIALSEAWERVRAHSPSVIATEDEDRITDQLVTELARMRKANEPPGFNSALFAVPVRDGKVPNRSGSSIDQMPDLTIYPASSRLGVADDRHDALFYECKVLKGKRGLTLYRKNGINRFLSGQYAWRMPHAGMIGYVFDTSPKCPVTALTKYFSRRTVGSTLAVSGPPSRVMVAASTNASDVARTAHARGSNADLIELRHLWLS